MTHVSSWEHAFLSAQAWWCLAKYRRNSIGSVWVRPKLEKHVGLIRWSAQAFGFCMSHIGGLWQLLLWECLADVGMVYDLKYGSAYSERHGEEVDLLLDVYRPTVAPGSKAPAVLLIHGGNFIGGSKQAGIMEAEALYFARAGFVVFNMNYRLEGSTYLVELSAVRDAVHDAKAAVRFIVDQAESFGVDPTRIAAWGESAGGITAISMNSVSGWWFGTWLLWLSRYLGNFGNLEHFLFFHILGIVTPTDELHHFSEGYNHQPGVIWRIQWKSRTQFQHFCSCQSFWHHVAVLSGITQKQGSEGHSLVQCA